MGLSHSSTLLNCFDQSSCDDTMATGGGQLEELDGLILEIILYRTGPKKAAALSCVSTRLRSAVSDNTVWSHFCADDFNLSEPVDPDGNLLPSFKEAYAAWSKSFEMYPLKLVRRATNFWASMRNWLAANFPEALNTLNKGASENQIASTEEMLGINLLLPTRVIYRICNGQNITMKNRSEIEGINCGIVGGYDFDGDFVNVRLLPIEEAEKLTRFLDAELCFMHTMNAVIVASSLGSNKYILLDCNKGQLHVGTQNMVIDGELMPCVPESMVRLGDGADMMQDGLMVWLEEHLRRLQSGVIGTRIRGEYNSISLYPEAPPLCSIAVTNGVKVRASAVLVPEGSNPGAEEPDTDHRYKFAYSICISLLPQGCMVDGTYYSSCQLRSCHRITKSRENIVDDVTGEPATEDEDHPLLLPGMEELVYESCTTVPAVPGSIEISLTFVPGSLSKPEGREFEVRVPPFALEEPEYIF